MIVFDDGYPIDDVCVIDSKNVKNGDFGVFKDTQMKDCATDEGCYYSYLRIMRIRGMTTDSEVVVSESDGHYEFYPVKDFAVFLRARVGDGDRDE